MAKQALVSRLEKVDWDFSGDNCASKFSTIHWHPCRFVSQIPAVLIGLLSKQGDLVVDPYCGSSTTLVEAQRLGRRSLGIDINPIAVLLGKAKLFPLPASNIIRALRQQKKSILDEYSENFAKNNLKKFIPDSVQIDKWYHPDTAKELAFLWSVITVSNSKYKPILQAAFSSILLSVCNETRHWGYVCDNTKPKSQRRVDAIKQFILAIERFIDAYEERDRYLGQNVDFPLPEAKIENEDAYSFLSKMESNVVDLVVSSPPYYGVCDYVKAQRLSMEWFEYDINTYRQKETGARSKRHRKTATKQYLDDLSSVIIESSRVLKRNGHIALIIGESNTRDSIINDVHSILSTSGFNDVLVQERTVPVQRRQHPSIKNEYVIIGSSSR